MDIPDIGISQFMQEITILFYFRTGYPKKSQQKSRITGVITVSFVFIRTARIILRSSGMVSEF